MFDVLLPAAGVILGLGFLLSAGMAWGARRAAALARLVAPEAFRTAPAVKDTAERARLVFLGDVQRGIADVVRPLAHVLPSSATDLLVSSGDLVSHGEGPYFGIVAAAFQRVSWTVPTRVVPGNHDLWPRRSKDDRIGGREFERVFGPRHWALRVGPVLVVGLDNGADWLVDDQLPWLEGVLAEHAGAPWILVCHRPLYLFSPEDREPLGEFRGLLALLETNKPQLVVSGHLHHYHDEVVGGVRHIVNAHGGDVHGLGLKRGDFQILQVEVNGDEFAVEMVSLKRKRDLATYIDQLAVRFWSDRRKPWGAVLAWPGRLVLRLLGRDVPVVRYPVERRVPARDILDARRRDGGTPA